MEQEDTRLNASKHSPSVNGDGLKYFVFASIISADNDEFTEEIKQKIINRYHPEDEWEDHDWNYILEPIGDEKKIERLVRMLK